MTPTLAEFMARVVPWPAVGEPGVINLHYTFPDREGMGGRPFSQLADFLSMVPWCNAHPGYVKDVYFCLSRQATAGEIKNGRAKAVRNIPNSTHVKAIWLDVDVKPPPKGYPDLKAALDAVLAFVQAAKLPPPSALVASGGGLHVYWFSDVPLTVAEWRPYANGLRALAQQHGLLCDYGVTTDACRVLRVPDTFNFKTLPPKPVKVLALAADHAFKSALSHIAIAQAPVTATVTALFDPAKFPPKAPLTDPEDSVAVGLRTYDHIPIDAVSVAEECPFFKDALLTHGKNHTQGMWNLSVLMATFFHKGEKIAHRMSDGFPTYTQAETQAMWDRKMSERDARGLGPPTCKAIENEGSKFCAGCRHRGQIKSPITLGKPVVKNPPIGALPVHDPISHFAVDLPAGYCVDRVSGHIGFMRKRKLGKGQENYEFEPIFLCKISGAWAEKHPDKLHFTATMSKGEVRSIAVEQKNMSSAAALCLTLSRQGVKYVPSNKELMLDFMSYFLQKLHDAKAALFAVPYGWWVNEGQVHGFAYGGRIFKDDQTEAPCGAGDITMRENYTPKGDIGVWFEALKLITDQHRPSVEAVVAASFASPLMRFTGEYAGCLSAWSRSGGNKSTAVKIGLGVWGHPKLTKEVAGTSALNLLTRMGDIRNLPVYWDDVSDPEKMAKVTTTISDLTEGISGGKNYQDGTARKRQEWQSLLIACSNISVFDHFVKKVKDNTAGVNRVFEFYVQPVTPSTPGRMQNFEASTIAQKMEENYGRMGEKYAKVLADNPEAINLYVQGVMATITKEVQAADDERFWVAIVSSILAGAALANQCGATFNIEELHKFLVTAYGNMRERVGLENLQGGTEANVDTILTEFLKEYGDRTLRTMDMIQGAGKPRKLQVISEPNAQRGLSVHIHWVVGSRLLRISKNEFYKFLTRGRYTPAAVMQGLEQHYGMKKPLPHADLTAGVPIQGGPEPLIVLPVTAGSWLDEVMLSHTPIDKMGAIPQGQSVAAPAPSGSAPTQPTP